MPNKNNFLVQIVGGHKFTINETVHVQQSDFGHVVYKVRTVDVKPVEPNDEATEGVEDETTELSLVDIDGPSSNGPENTNDVDDDRETVADTGDIDGNQVGSPEVVGDTNELTSDLVESFEVKK